MYCSQCGNPIADGSNFCGQCGAPVPASGNVQAPSAVSASTQDDVSHEHHGEASAQSAASSFGNPNKARSAYPFSHRASVAIAAIVAVVIVLSGVIIHACTAQAALPAGMWQAWETGADGKRMNKKPDLLVRIDGKGDLTAIIDGTSVTGHVKPLKSQESANSDARSYSVTDIDFTGYLLDSQKKPAVTITVPKRGFVGRWSASFVFPTKTCTYTTDIQQDGGMKVTTTESETDSSPHNNNTQGTWKEKSTGYTVTMEDKVYDVQVPQAYQAKN